MIFKISSWEIISVVEGHFTTNAFIWKWGGNFCICNQNEIKRTKIIVLENMK